MKPIHKRIGRVGLIAIIASACIPARLRAQADPAQADPVYENRLNHSTVNGATAVADGKLVRPVGDAVTVPGKPFDLVFTPDGSLLLVKSAHGLTVVDTKTFHTTTTLTYKDFSGSMRGLAVIPDADANGWTVYYTSAAKALLEAHMAANGVGQWTRKIDLPAGQNWGVVISADHKTAYVCMSIRNTLAEIDLASGKVAREIGVGVAPYDVVLSPDGTTAYVTNFGGTHPRHGELTEKSAGTDVAVDKRSIPISGSVSVLNLKTGKQTAEIKTGLHPTQIVGNKAGSRFYVADANSDSVSVIDAVGSKVVETIALRPDPGLPFGSIPDALALSADEQTLYVANAGNDAVAVVDTKSNAVRGYIPTGWFPGGLACLDGNLYVANMKSASITRVKHPDPEQLATFTKQVMADERVPQTLREMEISKNAAKPVPVPAQVGDPSVFHHVVYILKENKTYDQVLGDVGKGNSDPKLCTYGQNVTPNHHALANQFVLLDNYYCNGVNSSDGHQWATQGIIGEYFEKGSRSYDFGTDALCYASSDFIWDSCLFHGLSVRNYGEFDFPSTTSTSKGWFDIYRDWDKGLVTFKQSVEFNTLMNYTCHEYPGWNLDFPDVCRAKVFLKEFAGYEKSGEFPNFVLVYLPQDHTAGRGQKVPTPRGMVADNDLAVGQVVEAISKSRFWKDTCIFINEDDPQSGYDHVDGHRSLCLIASPYTRRGEIVSHFYNQTSVLHTMTQMLGLPPLNQSCAAAPMMNDCFVATPDPRPYECEKNLIALDERNPAKQAMGPEEQKLAEAVDRMDFSRPDRADENTMNRLIWIASGRTDPYPAEFSGPHGRGLAALHLKLVKTDDDDDDDD
jgi:YVTN family beta-propeller protein